MLIALVSTLAASAAWARPETAAEPSGVVGRIAAILEARAERPPEAPGPRPERLRGVGPGARLFFMIGADNAPCVRAFPDITGDGVPEVAVGIDESGVDNVFVLDGSSTGAATAVWAIETQTGVSGGSPYGDLSLRPIPDRDGNAVPDLLVGTAWGGRTAFSLDGQAGVVNWQLDTYLEAESGWVYSLDEVDDLTGDGVPEVVFGVGSDNDGVYLVDGASSGSASVRWRYQAPDGVLSVAAIGDVSGDGKRDVLAAVGDTGERLVCLESDPLSPLGNVLWSYEPGVTVFATRSMPDISGDGIDEALVAVWTSDGSAVRCVDGATGVQLWASTSVFGPGMLVDLLDDGGGDGIPEVIASSWENAVTVLDGKDGTLVWKTTVGTTNGGDVWSARAVGDLNADGRDDVAAGSFDGHVYALDGRTGEVFWAHDTGNRVFSVDGVGDLDGDGRPDVIAGTQDTTSSVVVYGLDGGAGIALFDDGFESGDVTAWAAVVP